MQKYHRPGEQAFTRQEIANSGIDAEPVSKEELETHEGLRKFFLEISDILNPQKDYSGDHIPSLEQFRKAFERYKLLEKLNLKVTLIHQMNHETAALVRDPKDPNEITIKSGSIAQFTGRGIYFGVDYPYDWISERKGGEAFVIRDVPLNRVYPSSTGSVMASLMVTELHGRARFDGPATIGATHNIRDYRNPAVMEEQGTEQLLLYSDDQPDLWKAARPGLAYYTLFDTTLDDLRFDTWYKIDEEYMGHKFNRYFLPAHAIDFINLSLGIVDIEIVNDDPEISSPYQRFYVKENNPLLCGAVAHMTEATEVVFGRPGTKGSELVAARKKNK